MERLTPRRQRAARHVDQVLRLGAGDYGPDAAERVRQPVPGDQVHPARTRQGHSLVVGAAKRFHDVTPDQAGTSGNPETRYEIASFLFTG